MSSETEALMARAAADPAVQQQLVSHDDYLGALKSAGELWMVACLLVGVYVMMVFTEQPGTSVSVVAGIVASVPIAGLVAAPGMWLSVTINRILRHPDRRVIARVTGRTGDTWIRRLDLTSADGPVESVVPRFKAFIEGTGGSMTVGTVAVAVLRGDQLVDWIPYSGNGRP